jgi:uncharacterized membrane protein
MILNIQRKGKNILIEQAVLQEYMTKKINELTGLATNVIAALIMISFIPVLSFFKAGDLYYFALLLIPLVGRHYLGNLVNRWLTKQFKELADY